MGKKKDEGKLPLKKRKRLKQQRVNRVLGRLAWDRWKRYEDQVE